MLPEYDATEKISAADFPDDLCRARTSYNCMVALFSYWNNAWLSPRCIENRVFGEESERIYYAWSRRWGQRPVHRTPISSTLLSLWIDFLLALRSVTNTWQVVAGTCLALPRIWHIAFIGVDHNVDCEFLWVFCGINVRYVTIFSRGGPSKVFPRRHPRYFE